MHILIVDDDPNNRKLIRIALEKSGYQTVEAENGEQAIRLANESVPALILMDIQMPVLDGISALMAIRSGKITNDIPVIALTSYAMKGDREHFLSQGFDDYVSKPIDIKGFLETIRKFVTGREQGPSNQS